MAFNSMAVSLEWKLNNMILRRGASILMIEAANVQVLRTLKEKNEFGEFFRTKALVNREARRVFEAWERKDKDLLEKLFAEMNA
ncbi:MAG: hypothetical protein FJY29_12775 [Betaproteobacteria bacterium]|nr:hypothetical protein [Betaproteobacteria bacterium]